MQANYHHQVRSLAAQSCLEVLLVLCSSVHWIYLWSCREERYLLAQPITVWVPLMCPQVSGSQLLAGRVITGRI
jgi:hypothetical protein